MQHSLNDSVDDGKLVLVHPKGMVVRVPVPREVDEGDEADNEPGDSYRDYFYRLGSNFAQRDELNPEQHPEIAQQLELAFSKPS